MNKVIFLFFSFSLISIFLFSSVLNAAENNIIISVSDPEGDDYGPGTYQYPLREVFQEEGLFDIQAFKIKELNESYQFYFSFSNLADPWQSRYGFSMPLIQLYIDNQDGGADELFKEGANVKLDPRYPWNHLLEITGWWVRHYRPQDRGKKEDSWMMEDINEYPYDLKNAVVKKDNNDIYVEVKKQIFGELRGANIFLIVGSFDAFGPGYFRSIQNIESNWDFYSPDSDELKYAPRVIDMVLPASKDQSKVLSSFTDEKLAVIYPLKISSGALVNNNRVFLIISLSMLFCLILLIYTMHKFPSYRNNIN